MSQISPSTYQRLVTHLRKSSKKITVVEQCCGGLISASLMSIPGSSAVYPGGTVAYNTRQSKKLLMNDGALHHKLLHPPPPHSSDGARAADEYVLSKREWTRNVALHYCREMDVDYAVAEGGAAGPTFRYEGMSGGFVAVAVAGKDDGGEVTVLKEEVVRSGSADREWNMRYFAGEAGRIVCEAVGALEEKEKEVVMGDGDSVSVVGGWLDRATKLRGDEGALKEMEKCDDAKTVVLRGQADALFSSTTSLGLLPLSALPTSFPKTFLGRDPITKSPFFSVTIGNDTTLDEIPPHFEFRNSRANAPLLPPHENEILLSASAFSNFRNAHSHCPKCGNPLSAGDAANTTLTCSACQSKLFPRLDPSIIVLVTTPCQSKALLTRPYRRPPRYHTAIAGFVEPGETIEAAVCRETHEETGVAVDMSSVRYVGSQSWPFPQSLMLGFRATATDEVINVDEDELAGAAWFKKAVVERSGAVVDLERRSVLDEEVARKVLEREEGLDLLIPPQGVLARRLIDDWLQQR